VNDGIAIEEVHGGHDAIPQFLFGRDADVAQHGAGQLGEEALDEVEPRAMLGSAMIDLHFGLKSPIVECPRLAL
jgi:hypothetical protein